MVRGVRLKSMPWNGGGGRNLSYYFIGGNYEQGVVASCTDRSLYWTILNDDLWVVKRVNDVFQSC